MLIACYMPNVLGLSPVCKQYLKLNIELVFQQVLHEPTLPKPPVKWGGRGGEGWGGGGSDWWWSRDRRKGGSVKWFMKSRESEKVEWGGESRGDSMDYQESISNISTATTKLQGPTNRETDRHTHTLFPPCLTPTWTSRCLPLCWSSHTASKEHT